MQWWGQNELGRENSRMKYKCKEMLILLCVGMAFVSCGGTDPVPVEIYPEEDVCETCRMLITDQRFASECLMKKGRAKKFDDVICMIRYFDMAATLGIAKREDVRAYFVKDYDSKEWVDARKAHFVKANVVTVMGYGVVAFKNSDRAAQFARDFSGQLLTFDGLWEIYKRPNAEKEITIKDGVMNPDVVTVKFGDLVEIRLNVEDDKSYRIAVKGYDNEGVFPIASKGHPAFLRLNAVRPGADFAFIEMESGGILGKFRVEGAHFQEELKRK
ncbi:putative lipoprotein involved in nitrous oxide reduction [Desulfomonile tiedjei DSM 6799]|uniref:Putative lipoprotein involved in nitrous oxide reduction n=2 Tax=Desulfomonile tiedjei TaxID=2358 RepID=I4C1E8_DESTA|nr:putative lipoprotein involved in nitrous oxide reduction [Desulfomonile tiedjei DSM 6799]